MPKRFAAIWFRYLITDRQTRRQPELRDKPFAFAVPERGRMVIKAVNPIAHEQGIFVGMVVADGRAILPGLIVMEGKPRLTDILLNALAEWSLRYTPAVAVDLPDGLILDISGCTHLWGGERLYVKDLLNKLNGFGYDVRIGLADTIGTAWAVAHYANEHTIVEMGASIEALLSLPPAALRLEASILQRLEKLGLYQIRSFIKMPRSALRRRFGEQLLTRLDQALGQAAEEMYPIQPIQPYQERLPSLEPIRTAPGIEIALTNLLEAMCKRLGKENKGLRTCLLKCYRVDGAIQQIDISTIRASRNVMHLFKLFEIKISRLEPQLGFELFILEAPVTEDIAIKQDALWNDAAERNDTAIAELLDKLAGKVGLTAIHRYLPDEHYWPERSLKLAATLQDKPQTSWRIELPRPVHLLPQPELIQVTVRMPDYPPMLFIYKDKLHNIKKADGPERIEQEWWLTDGQYRDYYCVEDEAGARYWLFRLGHYYNSEPQWFIHGFFA